MAAIEAQVRLMIGRADGFGDPQHRLFWGRAPFGLPAFEEGGAVLECEPGGNEIECNDGAGNTLEVIGEGNDLEVVGGGNVLDVEEEPC